MKPLYSVVGVTQYISHALRRTTRPLHPPLQLVQPCTVPEAGEMIRDDIAAKMEGGNIRATVRLLCSDDHPADFSASTLAQLQDKHPSAPPDRSPTPYHSTTSLMVDEAEVFRAVRSFPAGSTGGPDGLRPMHLSDLIRCTEFLTALTAFVNCY